MTRFYLAYLTANDAPLYLADFLNFRNMALHDPGAGIAKICVYIAASGVQPFGDNDRAAFSGLVQLSERCRWLEVRRIFFKGNVGRDFSSAEVCLQAIGEEAGPSDYVLVRNRSGYGPLRAGWYRDYVEQFERFSETGLVGSTINPASHLPVSGPTVHVQTYAYLSQWRHLQPLAANFPGAAATDRPSVITGGEIGLSRAMLERGLGISCLQWRAELFTMQRQRASYLPQADIKLRAFGVPLRYKYKPYFWQPGAPRAQLGWAFRLRASRSQLLAAERVVPEVLERYGRPGQR